MAENKNGPAGQIPRYRNVKDPTGVAALYLGRREGKELVYMGKVGTGWSRTVSSQIRKQLDTVVSPKSKLTKQRTRHSDQLLLERVASHLPPPSKDGLLRRLSFLSLQAQLYQPADGLWTAGRATQFRSVLLPGVIE